MEARKSFLSGHSSFSFFVATFLILYLQVNQKSIVSNRYVTFDEDVHCLSRPASIQKNIGWKVSDLKVRQKANTSSEPLELPGRYLK